MTGSKRRVNLLHSSIEITVPKPSYQTAIFMRNLVKFMIRHAFQFNPLQVILILFCIAGLPSFPQSCWADCGSSGASTPVTLTDETSSLPNSRQLVDGTGTTVDTSTPGIVKINAVSVPSVVSQEASVPSAITNLQTTATSNGDGTVFDITGYATVVLSVQGSLGGGSTVNFEVSADGGTNWTAINGLNVGTTTTGASTTTTGDWTFNTAGYGKIRARVSSYGSGSITVRGVASVVAGSGGGAGGGGGGSVTSNLTQINGTTVSQGNGTAGSGTQRIAVSSDNTPFPTIVSGAAKGATAANSATVSSVNSDCNALDVFMKGGTISVSGGSSAIAPGTAATYVSSDVPFAPGTSATDVWTMFGSGSTTVKIYYIGLSYVGTSSGQATYTLLRRSSVNSGGTSSTTTPAKMDSNNASATATVRTYTANPSSLGTSAGTINSFCMVPWWQTNNFTATHDETTDTPLFDYKLLGQPMVLRGTGEGIALNCGGTTPTGGLVAVEIVGVV